MQNKQNAPLGQIVSSSNLSQELNKLIDKLKNLTVVRNLSEESDDNDNQELDDNLVAPSSEDLQERGLFTVFQQIPQLFKEVHQLETNMVNAINILHNRITFVENNLPKFIDNLQNTLQLLVALENLIRGLINSAPAAARTTSTATQSLTFLAPSIAAYNSSELTADPVVSSLEISPNVNLDLASSSTSDLITPNPSSITPDPGSLYSTSIKLGL